MRRVLFAILPVLLWPALSAAAQITVQTDRDPVSLRESFQIEFEAQGDVDGDPDFSPLNRDFRILSTAQSSSFSFSNGRSSSTKTWTLTVVARRTGTIAIPSVNFGKDRSPPGSVTVTAAGAGSAGAQRDSGDVFIEVEAHPLQPLVQAQVIYTARLFVAVPVSDATLSDPAIESGDAVIERLGEDRNYETQVMGRRFKVLERNYAVFPQASGKIVIAPLQFQGRIGRDVFSMFDPFGPQPKAVFRQSAPIALDVRPIPAGFSAPQWLPAKKVQLSEEWSPDPPEFRAGSPLTRTLVLSADGLAASQLPDLAASYPDAIRIYPDQPVLNNRATPTGIIGSRQEKIAIIPSAPGEYVLPAISVPWWNTRTGELAWARLPERRITVLPGEGAAVPDSVPEPARAESGARVFEEPQAAVPPPSPPARAWMWISGFLAAAWLLTILLWRRQRRAGGPSPGARARVDSSRRAARAVTDACRANDARKARDALLQWAAHHWPAMPPRSIGELASRCEGKLARELERLNAALYARQPGDWNGNELRREFEGAAPRAEKRLAADDTTLEPLFRL
jgi:hypothetical protein